MKTSTTSIPQQRTPGPATSAPRRDQAPGEAGQLTRTVSVILTCRGDGAGALRAQLDALAAQELDRPWELLIADNGMTPAARGLAERFRRVIPGLRLLDVRDRPGQAYAINAAARDATGEDLVLLDADDVIATGYLQQMALALDEHEFVGGRLDSYSLNPRWLRERRRPLQAQRLECLLGDPRPVVVGAAMGVRKSTFQLVGGFDETLGTQLDVDLSWRLHAAGIRPHFAGGAVLRYRYRADLAQLWRQERAYGFGEAGLYAKHRRDGQVPRRPAWRTARDWLGVLGTLPEAGTKAGRARLVTRAGAATGRAAGSIAHRTLYL